MRSQCLSRRRPRYSQAFTLIELALTVGVVVLMFTLLIPTSVKMIEKVKLQKAEPELEDIAHRIDAYHMQNRQFPDSLLDVFGTLPLDPWGNPYQYLKLSGEKKNVIKGQQRKINAVLLNSDYDLYSMGPDGQSQAPLTAAASRDDIIRARNGNFFGQAGDFF